MSEPAEIDSSLSLNEETDDLAVHLTQLLARVISKLRSDPAWNGGQYAVLVRKLLHMRKTVATSCDDLISDHMSDPDATVTLLWQIIEAHSGSPEAVTEGTRMIEHLAKRKIRATIKPTDYETTIKAYVQWQNDTVRYFVRYVSEKPDTAELQTIKRLWNWNEQANEGIFFAGATRALHVRKVTHFAALMSIFYDRLWPPFKQNRDALVAALFALLRAESEKHWPKYVIFPSTAAKVVFAECLKYLYFKDRYNTWFLNSSASDSISLVHTAREIFAENFSGSIMHSPEQHTTEWILRNLQKRCESICDMHRSAWKPTLIVLLTSKNQFGRRIDVDHIHTALNRQFDQVAHIVTIVDGCQDGKPFSHVDIVVYASRFTSMGAVALMSEEFRLKNEQLEKTLTAEMNFPIGIVAQVYINLNMINEGLAYGVEELVNSSRWSSCTNCIEEELRAALPSPSDLHEPSTYEQAGVQCGISSEPQGLITHERNGLLYSFEPDSIGTVLTMTVPRDDNNALTRLWESLNALGHSVDCFVMDHPRPETAILIDRASVEVAIEHQLIGELRKLEARASDRLVWPLVPCWISSSDDISPGELREHFEGCLAYHRCLRLFLGRCRYPGKLSRFVNLVDGIMARNESRAGASR